MRVFILALVLGLAACGSPASAQTDLPNQPAIAREDANGTRVMVGWSAAPTKIADMKDRQTPDNPAFSGAELFHFTINDNSSDAAAVKAFEKAGMFRPRQVARTQLLPAAVAVLDSHSSAQGHAVMVEGSIDGEPAYGIAISLYGSLTGEDRKSGVHAFMAPKDKFKALGGFSIVVAQWFDASAAPDEDMSLEGSLAPQATTNRAAVFFNKWVEDYVIPMMGLTMQMQMKSIEQMSSWNNAAAICAGNSSCTMTQDSFGNWSANIE
jgi:hypothetical protein